MGWSLPEFTNQMSGELIEEATCAVPGNHSVIRCTQDHQFSKKCTRLGVLYVLVVQVTVTFDWVPCMCMIR